MTRYDVWPPIVSLIDNLHQRGSRCAESHVQVAVFYLQGLTRVPLGLSFDIAHNGPYSAQLWEILSDLESAQALSLHVNPPYIRSTIKVTAQGELILQKNPTYASSREIQFVARFLSDKEIPELERVSTALLMAHDYPERGLERKVQLLRYCKPHIPEDEAKIAFQDAQNLVLEWEYQAVPA